MQELITEQPNNWLQLYVDAMTEKDPYKRLALVRRLREVPRHDESDDSPERPRSQMIPKPQAPVVKPPVVKVPMTTAPAPQKARSAVNARIHLVRKQKSRTSSKRTSRNSRLRSA